MRPVLCIVGHDLTKVYRRGREEIHALKNVDFRVDAGEFVTIIGPSGSGKTALLNIIGFVFQQFHLMPTLSARENIELPLLFSHKSGGRNKIEEVLRMVGLEERGDHLPGQLSGGEMQRVAIGRALINDPHIILADEPTGNLDSATSLMIFDLFSELKRKGLTLIIVTHNKDLARRAEKMYTLRDGKIRVCEIFS
jgi:putative ABC transport system ATP-binding protein